MAKEKLNIRDVVFSPGEATTLALKLAKDFQENKGSGITSGIEDLDMVMNPMRPGELIVVLGRTGNFKSGFMNNMSLHAAKQFMNLEKDTIVVKGTWENSIEEDTLSLMAIENGVGLIKIARGQIGESDWFRINQSALSATVNPIWMVGHSQSVSKDLHRTRPSLTIQDFEEAIEMIAENISGSKKRIGLVVLDHLQRMNIGDRTQSMREKYMMIVDHCKDMAISWGCPVILGCQARREVDERSKKLPLIGDGQETSNVEQSADKMISLHLASMGDYGKGQNMDLNGESFDASDPQLLIMGLLKQRNGPASYRIPVRVDWSTRKIGSYYSSYGRDKPRPYMKKDL